MQLIEETVFIECENHISLFFHNIMDFMEYFRLDHPPNRLILCDRLNCEDIADYLEVNQHGGEYFACAAHTSSERHAAVLPKGTPNSEPHRSRPAA
jgi:hypothetical protein